MSFTIAIGQVVKKDNIESKNFKYNSPPSDPVLTAPDSARKNTKFVIKAVSTDPDSDKIYYRFKIGQDSPPRSWNGPYYSGYQFRLNVRILRYIGDLVIGFQAKDSNNAESGWSYHTITYKKEKSKTFILDDIISLFPQFSHIYN